MKRLCFFVMFTAVFLSFSSSHACFSDGRDCPSVFKEVFRGSFELPQDFSFDFSPIFGDGQREIFRATLRFVITNPERQPGSFFLLADGEEIFHAEIHRRRQAFRLDLMDLAPTTIADGRIVLNFLTEDDYFLRRIALNVRARNGNSEVPIPGAAWLLASGLVGLTMIRRKEVEK